MMCDECADRDETIATQDKVIASMVKGMEKATLGLKILNTKVKEQEVYINNLKKGLTQAVSINAMKGKLLS